MDDMQIAKLVMQIHANYVLIIDSKKNQIFLMGGAGVTHVHSSSSMHKRLKRNGSTVTGD
jgi:hypothetical protein